MGDFNKVTKRRLDASGDRDDDFGKEGFWLSAKGLSILLFAVTIVWLVFGIIFYSIPDSLEKSGQSGDMFGGVTALFSGLAFAGLIFTLFVQKQELRYQRKELSFLVNEQRETKGHLKDQADHLKSQSDFIEKQIFENSFFQLLRSFNEYVANTKIKQSEQLLEGRDAFEELYQRFARNVFGYYSSPGPGSVSFLDTYNRFYDEHIDDLGPYYRQLYNILKFIRSSSIQDQKFYSNVVRAQLSRSELSLLACNIASPFGSLKMAPLIKEFEVLKHCDDADFLRNDSWDGHLDKFFADWSFYKNL